MSLKGLESFVKGLLDLYSWETLFYVNGTVEISFLQCSFMNSGFVCKDLSIINIPW